MIKLDDLKKIKDLIKDFSDSSLLKTIDNLIEDFDSEDLVVFNRKRADIERQMGTNQVQSGSDFGKFRLKRAKLHDLTADEILTLRLHVSQLQGTIDNLLAKQYDDDSKDKDKELKKWNAKPSMWEIQVDLLDKKKARDNKKLASGLKITE